MNRGEIMALKLKDEPVTTVQKTGSDYVNRDYSKMADDILKGEDELPESRYSSSNTYQSMNNDMRSLDAQFEMEKYKNQYEKDPYTGLTKKSGFRTSSIASELNWLTGRNGLDNPTTMYIGIAICAIFIMIFFHRGMMSLRDMGRDTVEVEGTVISVDHKEEYVKRGRRSGRWVDRYRTTYEWVGENGEIQTNTRIYDERRFSKGEKVIVTVLANNLNEEIDSKSTAKSKMVSSFCFCIGAGALLVIMVIRLKKQKE